jgi:hypothetical protein
MFTKLVGSLLHWSGTCEKKFFVQSDISYIEDLLYLCYLFTILNSSYNYNIYSS